MLSQIDLSCDNARRMQLMHSGRSHLLHHIALIKLKNLPNHQQISADFTLQGRADLLRSNFHLRPFVIILVIIKVYFTKTSSIL